MDDDASTPGGGVDRWDAMVNQFRFLTVSKFLIVSSIGNGSYQSQKWTIGKRINTIIQNLSPL
jgi:hypothetical protein